MSFELTFFNDSSLIQRQAANEILKQNAVSSQFGLELTEQQALALVETRSLALKENGRIEFGGGVIDKLIYEFCDSPFISSVNYEQTLHDLIDIFYYYKNETIDLISDDELIKYMKKAYDGVCQGSLELLSGRELNRLARNLRFGELSDDSENSIDEEDDADDEY
ncbi:MAG: DUF6323 family protein [Oscillospiraceae bacterium]|nr:DUF6323 family protein [Oscillospiraceae bacterium]